MNLNKSVLAVQVLGTLLLAYGLGSWHNFSNLFVWPSWLALTMGGIGALLLFAVAIAKEHLDGVSKFMVILALAGVILLGFSARADLATHDPLGSMWRWVMVTALYLIAMVCSYGAISLPQRHAR
jgi:hypothetical protein